MPNHYKSCVHLLYYFTYLLSLFMLSKETFSKTKSFKISKIESKVLKHILLGFETYLTERLVSKHIHLNFETYLTERLVSKHIHLNFETYLTERLISKQTS